MSRLAVVELPGNIATRYCARLFAVMGATVIRVTAVDDAISDADGIGYGGTSGALFGKWLDQGKTRAATAEEARSTLAKSGVSRFLVVGDAGRVSLEIDGGTSLDVRWFDPSGPYGSWRGVAPVMNGLSGLAAGFGIPGEEPILAQGHGPEIITGATAFIVGAAAMFGQMRGWAVSRLSTDIFEAAMCVTEVGSIDPSGRGIGTGRLGVNRFVPSYPCAIFPSSDGWVGLSALNVSQWRALCELIDRPELADDPRFGDIMNRLARADEVDELISPALAQRTTDEWVAEGIARRIPFAPVPTQHELLEVSHWRGRQSFSPLEKGSRILTPGLPFRLERSSNSAVGVPALPAEADGPLAGIRVIDFTMGWAGPLATRHLADLGADIVKIESVHHHDWWRGPMIDDAPDPHPREMRPPFLTVNRNKRGLDIDLRTAEGRATVERLIAGADVVVDNFAAGVLEKLGFGPARQHELNPDIVSLSMGAFGATGPLRGIRGYGSTVEQASGLPHVNGEASWPPVLQHVAIGDAVAGLYGAVAMIAGLHGRVDSGGMTLDLAQVECLFQLGADALIYCQQTGLPAPRRGSARNIFAPCLSARCKGDDNWVALAIDGEEAWSGLCDLIGRPDLLNDPALSDRESRLAAQDEIRSAIELWSTRQDFQEAADALQRAGVTAAPVLNPGQLLDDPHLVQSGFWIEVDRDLIGLHPEGAAPYRLDGERPAVRRAAPLLGEHQHEIVGEFEMSA